MKTLFVVVDWDTRDAIRAFTDEEKANDFADSYWESTGKDCIVKRCGLEA